METDRAGKTAELGGLSRWRVQAEQHDLALAWIASAVIGALAISLIPEQIGPMRMLAPLCAMGVYIVFALTRSQYSTPRIADSVYFMGFIWTLWALINVLAWHPQLRAADLYVAFGYALITTATGMFVRLGLLQFYRTLDDQQEQAVDRIDERVAKLVSELEASQQAAASLRATGVLALQQWHKQFLVVSDQSVNDVKKMTEEFTAEGRSLVASIKTVQQSLTLTGRLLASFEKKLGTSIERTASAIERSVQVFESSVNDCVTQINAIQVSPHILESKLNELLGSVQLTLKPLIDQAMSTVADLSTALTSATRTIADFPADEELQKAVKRLIITVADATKAYDDLTRTADASGKALMSVGTTATTILTDLGKVPSGVSQHVNEVKTALESVRGNIEAVAKDAQKVDESLKDVVRFVQSTLSERR
jgi:biopolymer transport protein ExbB/TolQ